MFNSKIDKYKNAEHFYCKTGDGTEPDFVYDDNHDLKQVGVTKVYDHIQADAASGDINVLIQRFKNGEMDVLNQREGFYGDFSDVPESLIELKQRADEADDLFSQLDPSVKSLFKNADEFYGTYGTPEFFARISSGSGAAAPAESEVSVDE